MSTRSIVRLAANTNIQLKKIFEAVSEHSWMEENDVKITSGGTRLEFKIGTEKNFVSKSDETKKS